jgi:hypothetical protein
MANALYPKYKKNQMSGGSNHNLISGSVKAVLIADTYAYNATHEFLADIPAPARVSISGALASKAVTDGAAFQSANGRFEAVTGPACNAIGVFVDTGNPATSPLVCYIDTVAAGLPVTPAGASYNVVVDPTGWFVE